MSAWSGTLTPLQRMTYERYAQSARYTKALEGARAILADGLARCARPYVACSFGKDSSVLLHLALQARPDIEVRFVRWSESELLDDYAAVIDAWRSRANINVQILDLSRASLDDTVADRWQQLAGLAPCDGYLIGLRAEESKPRRMTLRVHGTVYRTAAGLTRIAPLAWWHEIDIAAYCLAHDLPLLATYVHDGIGARTSSRVPRDAYSIRGQTLAALKHRDPDRWNKLCRLYPEVAQLV